MRVNIAKGWIGWHRGMESVGKVILLRRGGKTSMIRLLCIIPLRRTRETNCLPGAIMKHVALALALGAVIFASVLNPTPARAAFPLKTRRTLC